ncbi:molybdate ABC transporter substrate-binding protein [Algoriphagus halophytocola]|uniref:molybdate ABC transporter substrate-binding protein n=1 Tax=Algoriphagus halophytocola TaxID=2991499 RepID=UPI0022DDE551|nr:molybdate ABC transporter substrate-binding protein [Algoriphagus sp. TR-M9]WBL44745.1 molybdate ABC transporter substrate-binding protein [Algoriphagus sp. TR-M9]
MLPILLLVGTFANAQGRLVIAAASDLQFALDSVIQVFNQRHQVKVDVIYGSSGKLFEQISNGAPFDLYFSADIAYPQKLAENGLAASEVYAYGLGRIVIWSRKIAVVKEQMHAFKNSRIRKIAIANPAHAPYGMRAEEALLHFKLWTEVESKLVFGENISQTAQFVTSGAADIGIVALSLALSPNMQKQGGNYYLIPAESHKPLVQGAVITKFGQGKKLGVDFLDFVKGQEAGNILSYYGFTKP